MSKIKESELLSTAFRKQELSLFPNWCYFIRCFILYKLEKHPLTFDFYANIKAKCDNISQNIVQFQNTHCHILKTT